jgi:hypothetical protein
MESRIRILQWLRLLLLSAGAAGWRRRARQDLRFRQYKIQHKRIKLKIHNSNRIRELNDKIMESRLRILQWLSLLLLSAGLVGWCRSVMRNTRYRRPQWPPGIHKSDELKFLIKHKRKKKRTMESPLLILRRLGLLQMQDFHPWELQNLAYFSGFRRP